MKNGEVKRNEKNYKERYDHLNSSSHNYLRITRILKCLGICGLESFKFPFLKHMITEVFKNKELDQTTNSLIKYWLPTIRIESKLEELENYIKEITGKRISRKFYDKEERTWANICTPIDSSKSYGDKKTFYNRDDEDDLRSNDLLDIDPPSRYVWSSSTYQPITPTRVLDEEAFYSYWDSEEDEYEQSEDEIIFSDEDINEKINEDEEEIEKPKLYRPPKLVPVEFNEEFDNKTDKGTINKRLEHLKRRAYHSDILDDYKTKYSDAPEEFYNSERSRVLQNNRSYKEKTAYEEDYLKRLPQTKRERLLLQRSMDTNTNDVMDHLHDANILFDENLNGLTKTKKKGKLSRQTKKRVEKKKQKSVKRLKSRK